MFWKVFGIYFKYVLDLGIQGLFCNIDIAVGNATILSLRVHLGDCGATLPNFLRGGVND